MSRAEAAELSHGAARIDDTRAGAALLALLSLFLLFHSLGAAALFDPDEGRNAEIAREVLVTNDWITPYYDFLPRLEKPMLFYAVTALSYKLFGVSEAAARLPSAITALGVVLVTFFLARRFYGERAALWTGLVLVTSVQFGAFSRIVILDMMLTFFITVALAAYYRASVADGRAEKRRYYFIMYAAAAVATLVKGPIGFVVPGMIVLAYIAARRKWSSLREMQLGWGILIFLVIVSPWYIAAEIRRPGYLAYFIGQEHFSRYASAHFNRSKPWHYFFMVIGVGFLPWTFVLPSIVSRLRQKIDELSFYAILWAVVPFVFYSFSGSKMSEYLLPIYPALALLAGNTLSNVVDGARLRFLSLGWLLLGLAVLSFFVVLMQPAFLPSEARDTLVDLPRRELTVAALIGGLLLLSAAWLSFTGRRDLLFPVFCLALALLFFLAHRFIAPLSMNRSYKEFGVQAAARLGAENAPVQVAIYDTYLPSLPFYLGIREPIWVVTDETDEEVLGSFYVAANRPAPAPGYGRAMLTHEEFEREWSSRQLFVFVKEKRLFELHGAKVLLRAENVVLVTNR